MSQVGSLECAVEELQSTLEAGLQGHLIDVREPGEYAAGRIPGALSFPLPELYRCRSELDSGATIYVVCRTGRRSREAQRILCDLGFRDVRNVNGGYVAWQLMGGECERDTRTAWTLERQIRFTAGALVLAGTLLGMFVASWLAWLPALVGAGLVTAALTDTCAMGSVLSKLPWNRRPTRCSMDSIPPEEV